VEYRNDVVEEGFGKLVYVRAVGAAEGPDQEQLQVLIEDPRRAFSAPLHTATWLARLGRLRRGGRPFLDAEGCACRTRD
jgi:hypothetical protein